ALSRRDALASDARRRAERVELLTFQAKDIDDAAPQPAELEKVEARHKLLSQLDHVRTVTGEACTALTEGDAALPDSLAKLAQRLLDLSSADAAVTPIAHSLQSAAMLAREAARDLLEHTELLEADPGELAVLDSRLSVLRRLTARYGPTIDDVLRFRAAI